MKTAVTKPADVVREWFVIDAEGKTLGRLAVTIADLLRGKGKPNFSPHLDAGDFVIVTNADKIHVSGKKADQKLYRYHTQWPGGFKTTTYKHMLATHPERIIEKAVKGMLPHNTLGAELYTKLKVYAGASHPHAAQQPKPFTVTEKGQRSYE
jgi:large subunit ribosomal protein L13